MTTPTEPPKIAQLSAQERCRRAIAYLKAAVHDEPVAGETTLNLGPQESPVLQTYCGDLLASYVVDEDDAFHFVQCKHLTASGMSLESLHTTAVANLAAIAAEKAQVRQFGRLYGVLMGGNFEASLVLVDEFWNNWFRHVAPNGFVAMAPARDILAFADADDSQAVAELRILCERAWNSNLDHPLTSELLIRRDGKWAPLRH